ncbi:MAG: hypothetical protein QGF46_06215 [Planctomycetota bacterium]|nr:hypothetical protein [Planctomycetota bacterium]
MRATTLLRYLSLAAFANASISCAAPLTSDNDPERAANDRDEILIPL